MIINDAIAKDFIHECIQKFMKNDFQAFYTSDGRPYILECHELSTLRFSLSISDERISILVADIRDIEDFTLYVALDKNKKGEVLTCRGDVSLIENEFDKIFKLWVLNLIPRYNSSV